MGPADNSCKAKVAGLQIRYLKDRPADIPTLVRWFKEEWAPWYGPGGMGNAEADLLACRNKDALPLALIAINNDDGVIGTAALKRESLGVEFGYEPWLTALFVARPYRRLGVGGALIEAIEKEARRLGYQEIYVSTDMMGSLLSHRGWKPTGERVNSLRGPVRVYVKKL